MLGVECSTPTAGPPWPGLETPARTYCGGDLVATLLNDLNGGQRPRHRCQDPERLQRRPTTKTPWLGLETLVRTYCGGGLVAKAPERLQRRLTSKTPWLGPETPARTYCGGDFVARLLDDFSGGQRPRPRG